MNYGKRRRLTTSDDCEPRPFVDRRESLSSTNTDTAVTRDAGSLSRFLREGFSWFVDSFFGSSKMSKQNSYKIFKSKDNQEARTDVFVTPPQSVRKSPKIFVINKETPIYQQSNSFNTYSAFNNNHKMNRFYSPSKSGINVKEFYGKSNQNKDCVVIADDDAKGSLQKEKHSPFLSRTGPDIQEIKVCADNKEVDENEKSDFALMVKRVYFGSYSCLVKGVIMSRECFKFINVPSRNGKIPFKYHISIPISEIYEISSCISDVQVFLLLRTVSSSNMKICDALKLNKQSENGLVIIEMDPKTKDHWKIIEDYLTSFDPEVPYTQMPFVEVNSLIRELSGSSESSEMGEAVIVDRVYTPEKRKVAKSAGKYNSTKPKQMKPNTIIEIDDSSDVDEKPVNFDSSSDTVLNYPPDEQDSITISSHDMKCLEEEQFLNDSILGFYLKYIQRQLADKSIATKSYIFNTFFYGKLSKQKKTEDMSKTVAERVYDRVKNWTKSVDIFEKDFLIIPMNKNYHWFLAIICYPKLVSVAKSNWREQCKLEYSPCIIYMDSLGTAKGGRLSDPIRHFLSMEWQKKKGTQISFGKQVLPDHFPRVPYQTNSSDCGLFVLQYVEQFLKDPDFVLDNLASVDLEDWFPLSVIHKKRNDLRCLITMLANESKEDCESEPRPSMETIEAMNVDVESPIPHIFAQVTSSVAEDMPLVKQEKETESS